MPIPAIVTAGDRGAARAVRGESKVYLEVGGRPLVARVVAALQAVPEISEVWVVGDGQRLEALFSDEAIRSELRKPLHIVPQFDNLYENSWETFRRTLPGAPVEGRDPVGSDLDHQVLFLSADLPFATPHEISDFVRKASAEPCDYALGVVPRASVADFQAQPDRPGLEVSFFNMREGRMKQSNLHLARPARMGNRHYIQEMYQHRHMREFGNMLGLAWRLMRAKQGGLSVAFFYGIMHLGGVFDRWRLRALADWWRQWISMERTEKALSRLLDTRFRFIVTEVGGCAIDVDTDAEYETILLRFDEWTRQQRDRAETIVGALPLPERAANAEVGVSREDSDADGDSE